MWLRIRDWLGRRPALSAMGVVAALWALLVAWGAVVIAIDAWWRERECVAQGNQWDRWQGCLARVDECVHGDRRLPVGAVFGEGCYACECLRYGGARCRTGRLCELDNGATCDPTNTTCVFDPGCDAPRAYHALFVPFEPRPYCGCDGVTFVEAAPSKPYRYVGVCGNGS